jgi:hypothetical protein
MSDAAMDALEVELQVQQNDEENSFGAYDAMRRARSAITALRAERAEHTAFVNALVDGMEVAADIHEALVAGVHASGTDVEATMVKGLSAMGEVDPPARVRSLLAAGAEKRAAFAKAYGP